MKFISKYRRHKGALPILIMLALTGLGLTFSAATAAPAKNTMSASAKSTIIEEGKEIFLKGCSSCHGLNLEGGAVAPSLIGVGAASVDFQVGTGRMPMQDMSQQAARKTPVYNEEQVAALAAYVASLAPGPRSYTNEEITWERDGNTAEGGELFRTNCAQCHNFAGSGGALTNGKYAPSLGQATPLQIYEAMITGPQSMPIFSDETLTPESKAAIIRYIQELNKSENPGGMDLGRLGPVTEGLVLWVVGLGVLIIFAVWIGARVR